jgi:spermidine synthase
MMWKTVGGRCIYQGNNIQIKQNWVYRWLTFDSNALQTLINRHHPQIPALHYIFSMTRLACLLPGPSCLLGLGGGSAAHALAPYLEKFQLDVVENNLEIITLAADYFMTGHIKNMKVIHQDAYEFIQNTSRQYQHLLVDIFNANSFPEHCNSSDFFKQCHRILAPGGLLAVNLANASEQWRMFDYIRQHFPQCTATIPVKKCQNIIVLAYKGKSINKLLYLLRHHYRTKRLYWDAQWGYIVQ